MVETNAGGFYRPLERGLKTQGRTPCESSIFYFNSSQILVQLFDAKGVDLVAVWLIRNTLRAGLWWIGPTLGRQGLEWARRR